MAKIALYTSFGLVIFVASAAASLCWQRSAKPAQEQQRTLAESGGKPGVPADMPASAGHPESGELPVVVRPRPATTEEILRLGTTMRNREKTMNAREEAIQKERSRLKLILDDIQSERLELEALQTEIHGKLAAAEKLLGELLGELLILGTCWDNQTIYMN